MPGRAGRSTDEASAESHLHAVQLLLNRLDGDQSPPAELPADYDLAIRESTTGTSTH